MYKRCGGHTEQVTLGDDSRNEGIFCVCMREEHGAVPLSNCIRKEDPCCQGRFLVGPGVVAGHSGGADSIEIALVPHTQNHSPVLPHTPESTSSNPPTAGVPASAPIYRAPRTDERCARCVFPATLSRSLSHRVRIRRCYNSAYECPLFTDSRVKD